MSLAPEPYIKVQSILDGRQYNPLVHWRFAVKRLREAFSLFTSDDPIIELHLRACNKGTKSQTVAAFVVACLQKRPTLDGVPIPQWRGPIEAAQFVLDYKQQLLSVQAAYLKVLGNWPHHIRYNGEVVMSIRIKPIGADDNEASWSVVHFLSQENRKSGTGVRADIAAFDEPPLMPILREMRKAAHAGRRGILLVGETPTVRLQWAPLREDYGDTPRRSIRRIDPERAEVRWSLDEVADWVIDKEEKARLRRQYANDPLKDAREHGDYTNTEGKCPFDVPTLLLMQSETREPKIVRWRVTREAMHGDSMAEIVKVPVEVFEDAEPGLAYYLDIDPASGVDDSHHNPAGLHISKVGTGDLVVRWNGYLAPYSVGVLAAGLGRQYNAASVDVEMKDHWGVNVIRGLEASDYGNICYEQRELHPGEWAKEVGFDTNEQTRAIIIGSVQEWLEAWRSGVKYARCPSRAVLDCILDCELDERGKIVAAPGIDHGEDLVLLGQKLRRAVTITGREMPELYRRVKTPDDELAALISGEKRDDDDYEPPFQQRHVNGRKRPRG